jgi:hypothetical protein
MPITARQTAIQKNGSGGCHASCLTWIQSLRCSFATAHLFPERGALVSLSKTHTKKLQYSRANAGICVAAPASTARAKDCLAAPNSPAPEGRWWYYRLDWPTQTDADFPVQEVAVAGL